MILMYTVSSVKYHRVIFENLHGENVSFALVFDSFMLFIPVKNHPITVNVTVNATHCVMFYSHIGELYFGALIYVLYEIYQKIFCIQRPNKNI